MNKVTLEEAKGKVLYVRCHADVVPGPYVKAFDLEEVSPLVWEAKIAMEAMTLEQRRDFTEAVENYGGIRKVIWTRYLEKGIVHRETNFKCSKGNFAKSNCGEMKMSEGKVQEGRLLVKLALVAENADGTVFAKHGHEFNMTEEQFAWLQDSVDGGTMADLKKLRDQKLAAKAAA